MAPILVTGANGFLGSRIVAQMRSAAIDVRSTDLPNGNSADLPDFRPADLLKGTHLASLLDGVQCVVHAAGLAHQFLRTRETERRLFDINVTATEKLMRAASSAGVEHFVLISSVAVYGPSDASLSDETTACSPIGAYAISKRESECRVIRVAEETGMRATILRMATVYGEMDPGNIARLIRKIDEDQFVWIGSGRNLKSLIYREDAARACVLASQRTRGRQVEVYNVTGPPCSIQEVVCKLASALQRRLPRWHVPASLARFATATGALLVGGRGRLGSLHAMLRKWLANDAYDGRKFQESFGFRAEVAPAEGLRREVAWYRKSAA